MYFVFGGVKEKKKANAGWQLVAIRGRVSRPRPHEGFRGHEQTSSLSRATSSTTAVALPTLDFILRF